MKKLRLALLVVVVFAMLALLFVFMSMPIGIQNAPMGEGTATLGGGAPDSNTVYTLDGDWEFYYGDLLTPQDFADGSPQGALIPVPSAWEASGYPAQGAATYRLWVEADAGSRLSLYIEQFNAAQAVWINGVNVYNNGTLGETPDENRFTFRSVILPVTVPEGGVELIIQAVNHRYFVSGPVRSLYLAERDAMWSWYIRTRALYCAALGALCMTAFYHLVLYLFRRRETEYLLFSLLCFLCVGRFCFEGGGLTAMLGLGGDVMVQQQIYSTLLFLQSAMVGIFSLFIFRPGLCRRLRAPILAYLALGAGVFALLSPAMTYGMLSLLSVALGLLPVFAAIAGAVRSPVLRGDRWMWMFLVGLFSYAIVGTAFKMILQNAWYMLGLLNNVFIILVQGLVLSRNYTRAFTLVEETNANLEGIVSARTAELQTANTAMKELMGNISHDLKTPLTVMGVNLEKLASATATQEDEDYRRMVGIAYNKNLDLQRLTQNLFEVSRIETGRVQYSPEWLPLSRLLAEMAEKYGDHLDSVGILLDITSTEGGQVWADRQKVWSVFDNILYNAVRYTPPGGSITVSTQAEAYAVTITVRDTGCGIPPEHLPHIFERFYKADHGRGGEGESGVGLYIVRSIMEGMGGGVSAESGPEQGAAIRVEFRYKPM